MTILSGAVLDPSDQIARASFGAKANSLLCEKYKQVFRSLLAPASSIISMESPDTVTVESDASVVALAGRPYLTEGQKTIGELRAVADAFVRLYDSQGTEALRSLHGQFVVIALSKRAPRVTLAVDRFSTMPLYYAMDHSRLIFSTDVDILRDLTNDIAELDSQVIYEYLYFHVVPTPKSIFKNIRRCQAGHALVFESGQAVSSKYWVPDFDASDSSVSGLRKDCFDALQLSVCSNTNVGRIGCFLSGGLDSSTIAGMLAGCNAESAAFSIGFSVNEFDEMEYARRVAKHFNIKHYEHYVTPEDIVECIPDLVDNMPEPFGNSSLVPTYCCARLAKDHGFDTLLAGDGGDELFAGNSRYRKQLILERYMKLPKGLRSGFLEPVLLSNYLDFDLALVRKIRSYVFRAGLRMPDRMYSSSLLEHLGTTNVLGEEFLCDISMDQPKEHLRAVYEMSGAETMLEKMLELDWRLTLVDNDLTKVNLASVTAGIEVRYPFLDDRVVELANSVPSKQKIKGDVLRYFYKEAFKEFLPMETISKTKHGFGLPIGRWILEHKGLREMVLDQVQDFRSRKIIRVDFLDKLLNQHLAMQPDYYGTMVWVVFVLELWFKRRAPAWCFNGSR